MRLYFFIFGVLFYLNGQAQFDQNDSEATYKMALDLCYRENFKDALPLFDALIASNSPIDQLYFDRGIIKKHLGDYTGAILDFSTQIEQTPQDADAYFLRGELLLQVANFETAFTDLKRATKLDPGNADAHCYLAKAAAQLGKKRTANCHIKFCKSNTPILH